MKTIHIGRAQSAAKARNDPTGYMAALMKVGTPVTHFGQPFLQIGDADYAAIRQQFSIIKPPPAQSGRAALPRRQLQPRPRFKLRPKLIVPGATIQKPGLGLGTIIGSVATPIAKAMNAASNALTGKDAVDCVDKTTGQLKPESRCAQEKARLDEKYRIKLPFSGK